MTTADTNSAGTSARSMAASMTAEEEQSETLLAMLREVEEESHQAVNTRDVTGAHLDYLLTRISSTVSACDILIEGVDNATLADHVRAISTIRQHLVAHARSLIEMYSGSPCTQPLYAINGGVMLLKTGEPGRPSIELNINQVELLREVGYTWQEVANALLVSRTTLWRWRKAANLTTSRYTAISDDELDSILESLQHRFPRYGQRLMQGQLESMGIRVQRSRLSEALTRIDPTHRRLRWREIISRRTYRVAGPNSLWHIDGHHSLIRWRFVLHGGIDGFSRLIVFLQCSTNNCAETVFQLFQTACEQHGIPSRVRSDKGCENMKVCYYMIARRGTGRGSHIAGSSTHNQRIERLWRDVYRCVCSTFHSVFYFMEDNNLLDPDCEVDIFLLHCVFLPRINAAIEEFKNAWNRHPMRTEHNWSPRKIWINGVLNPHNHQCTGVRDLLHDNPVDTDIYGIDPEGPIPQYEERPDIEVPVTLSPLGANELEQFLRSFNPLQYSNNFGIDVYVHARQILESML